MGWLFAFFLLSPFMWGSLLILAIVLSACADDAPEFGVVLVLAALSIIAFANWPGFLAVVTNPGLMVVGITFYFVAGVIWSFVKWYFFNLDAAENFRERLANARKIEGYRPEDFRPKASDNKRRIIAWIGYWPFSLLRFLLGDVVKRIATKIYQMLAKQYDAVSRRMFREFEVETKA